MATTSPNFGSCWSCVSDLTMPATTASGFRVVAEAIARRWQTPRGALVGDPNYGTDLGGYVNDDMARGDLIKLAKSASSEAEKDERVQTCTVVVSQDASGNITINGSVTTAQGPFQLVFTIANMPVAQAVELLNVT